MYREKTQVLSTLSKVLEQLKSHLLFVKVIPGKVMLKIHLAAEIIQDKKNAINVSIV